MDWLPSSWSNTSTLMRSEGLLLYKSGLACLSKEQALGAGCSALCSAALCSRLPPPVPLYGCDQSAGAAVRRVFVFSPHFRHSATQAAPRCLARVFGCLHHHHHPPTLSFPTYHGTSISRLEAKYCTLVPWAEHSTEDFVTIAPTSCSSASSLHR